MLSVPSAGRNSLGSKQQMAVKQQRILEKTNRGIKYLSLSALF